MKAAIMLFFTSVILCVFCLGQHTGVNSNQQATPKTVERVAVEKTVQRGLGQSPLFKIDKVAMASDYALVSWLQGEGGGMALLNKKSGGWKILAHSGGWYGMADLKQFGVPQSIAERLLTQIDPKCRNYE